MKIDRRTITYFGAILGLLTFVSDAWTQPPPRKRRGGGFPEGRMQRPTESPEAAPRKTRSTGPITAIVGGDCITVTRETIRKATILVQDGKILEIGQDVKVPAGATVVDAKGKTIVPGFIALSTSGVGVRMADGSGKFEDALNPYDRSMKFCLGVGITTAVSEVSALGLGRFRRAPDGTEIPENEHAVCPCCGVAYLPYEPIFPPRPETPTPRRHAVIKLSAGELDEMFVKDTPFYHLNGGALVGAANKNRWRQEIRQARDYIKAQAEHEQSSKAGKKTAPPTRRVAEEIVKVAKKEIPLRTDASSVSQIRDAIALAKELDYNLILDGAEEGWLAADELSSAKVSVIYTPRRVRRPVQGLEETTGSSANAPEIFQKAGVSFAIRALATSVSLDGIAGRDLTSLPLEAAFAIRGGASEKAALEALTIVPARMLGLADRIGSLEVGKDADLLIMDGPPLDYRTYVEKAMVAGTVRYDRFQDRVYPDPLPPNPVKSK